MNTCANLNKKNIFENQSLEDLSNEVWKQIKGYNGKYLVSNFGRIKSVLIYADPNKEPRYNIIKQFKSKYGYPRVLLRKVVNGRTVSKKNISTHRLVALAFIDNPLNKRQVNHKNGIKDDNRAENLEWTTAKENVNHSHNILKNRHNSGDKKVYQYDSNGNFVKEYSAIAHTKKDGFNICNVSANCHKRITHHRGKIFSFRRLGADELNVRIKEMNL